MHYGGCCIKCKFADTRALSIDHIDGRGNEHRKNDRSAKLIYRWLRNRGYPKGYQVLCMNCQFITMHERKVKGPT